MTTTPGTDAPLPARGADWTTDELVIARIARDFSGEVVATGATVHSYLAARLAKALHAPELAIVGGSLAGFDCPVTPQIPGDEFVAGHLAPAPLDWLEQWDLITADRFRIVLGPAQIDRHGNCNISVLGDWSRPTVQMIGSRGIPDDAARLSELSYHVVRHSTKTFVERVDFVCGPGFGAERRRLGMTTGLPRRVVSDLGVFGFDPAGEHMVIESLHPGVSFEHCRQRTGFAWPEPAGPIPVTAPPTEAELRCLREVVDPHGVRLAATGQATPELLATLYAAERRAIAEAQAKGPVP
ncbi:CoA-transferase [Streptomyces luteolus]|uniref:CoA-transferase n=1 Tax=Streptomyces luteolus TaxID=3043615 RepID=A0ABT6SPR8_9ACTN|nr:CoA-transferase [Streptomyces sp. B-S-A12]MDI3417607.1 CoA-transferase [Streptomyces sp. B-S-A12]